MAADEHFDGFAANGSGYGFAADEHLDRFAANDPGYGFAANQHLGGFTANEYLPDPTANHCPHHVADKSRHPGDPPISIEHQGYDSFGGVGQPEVGGMTPRQRTTAGTSPSLEPVAESPQPRIMESPRVVPVILFSAATAAVIAWSLRDHARFLPTGAFIPRHALATSGHHQSGYAPPPPVTGEAVINYPGLIMLALHLTAAGILGAAWLVRKYVRDQVKARLSFAVLGAVIAAFVTIPAAAMTLGNAILFTGTVAAAMTVLQYTFVLVVAGTALFGVP